jgi:hypothetical protein
MKTLRQIFDIMFTKHLSQSYNRLKLRQCQNNIQNMKLTMAWQPFDITDNLKLFKVDISTM